MTGFVIVGLGWKETLGLMALSFVILVIAKALGARE